MFRLILLTLIIGAVVIFARQKPSDRTRFQEAAIAKLSSARSTADQFTKLMTKFDTVWEKRRASIYEKMKLSREQLSEIESARRELAKEREQIMSKYGFDNPTEDQIDFVNEKLSESERYYDAQVESLIGPANFKNLKAELDTFNKWLEAKSPTKLIFISDW